MHRGVCTVNLLIDAVRRVQRVSQSHLVLHCSRNACLTFVAVANGANTVRDGPLRVRGRSFAGLAAEKEV